MLAGTYAAPLPSGMFQMLLLAKGQRNLLRVPPGAGLGVDLGVGAGVAVGVLSPPGADVDPGLDAAP